jgi:hypothetical protein
MGSDSFGADAGQRRSVQLLSVSVRGGIGLSIAGLDWPASGQELQLDDQTSQTGWQVLGIPVDEVAGQVVVLTLRLRPVNVEPPPFSTCSPHVVLLDNLRFA